MKNSNKKLQLKKETVTSLIEINGGMKPRSDFSGCNSTCETGAQCGSYHLSC